jgi:glutaconate CoA-transferase subunit B
MYLAEIHPRITVEDIKKDVPWDLKISENLSETKRPSDEEIDFIRKFAPAAAMGRALSTEVAFANLAGELEERGKM